jgi:dynein assembly factor 5
MTCGITSLVRQCSAVGDDDVKVAKRTVATIHIVGFHVPPEKWLPLVLKPLGNTKTSQPQVPNFGYS